MFKACLVGMTAVVIGLVGCGSDDVTVGGGGSTTTTTITGQGGAGGEGTTTTTSSTTTTTTGQGGNGGGGGGSSSCASLGDVCTDCLYANCNQTYCGCFDNQECVLLVNCLQGCQGDQACQQTCMNDHPAGVTDALLVSDCTAISCDAECPGAGQDLPPCQECLFTMCETEIDACFANPDCFALLECVQNCPMGDQACQQQCASQHIGGIALAQAVLSCGNTNCGAQCQ